MKDEMTLREVCDALSISRRAVQGYEKYDLVEATGKTNRGYLLYDEEAQKQISRIKLYQSFGFRVSEMKDILELPDKELKQCLMKKREELLQQKQDLRKSIEKITELINSIS